MNIENTLKTLIEGEGYRYVHLIDGHALNTMLPQLTKAATPFVVNYVSLGSNFFIVGDRRYESSRIQMLMADIVPFNSNAETEADSVSAIHEEQKTHIAAIVDALNASGSFEQITQWSCVEVPLRFDAVCACTTVEFTLADIEGTCIDED